MTRNLLHTLTAFVLSALPLFAFAQGPSLGTAANFVLFTTTGAVTNTDHSQITGDVGTNDGAITGFGNVNGKMQTANGATAQAALDLDNAYTVIAATPAPLSHAPLFGNGETITPGVYAISGNSTLNNILTLNGLNDPNAVFIFKINGTFGSGAGAQIVLIGEAKACNVFWQVEGMISLAANTKMRGNMIANNAAIDIAANVRLEGRALSTTGAITTNSVTAYLPTGCGSPVLTGPAAANLGSVACFALFSGNGSVTNSGNTFVTGDIGTNVGLTTGFNPLFVTGTVHPIPNGTTAAAATALLNAYNYLNSLTTDIELLYPAQFGNSLVLTPHVYLLNAATSLTDTLYLNAEGNANAVFVIKINGALATSVNAAVVLTNGATAENVFWVVNGAANIGDNTIMKGTLIVNNGAVTLSTNVQLAGRALTTNGAFNTAQITAAIPSPCSSTPSTSQGLTINQTAPASATNFISFAEAAAYLHTVGVTGPTVIEVVTGTGPYNGQFLLNQIPGSSANNMVIIEGNGNTLAMCDNSSGKSIIYLNGTDNITIYGLNLVATCAFGTGIWMDGGNDNVTISNNTINVLLPGYNTSSGHNNGIVALGTGSLSITNNIIMGGRRGIVVFDASASLTLTGNTLTDAYQEGIRLAGLTGANISHNTVTMRSNGFANSTAIEADRLNGFTLNANYLTNMRSLGISLNNSNNGVGASQSLISNNRIGSFLTSSGYAAGIYMNGVNQTNIYHNSVRVNSGASGAGLQIGWGSGMNLRNNILAYTSGGDGYAMYVSYVSTFQQVSHNNFYNPGTNFLVLGQEIADVAGLSALGFGTGTLSVDPMFTSDMHTGNTALRNTGTSNVLVQFDFEGDERGSATFGQSDIGADEMSNTSPRLANQAATLAADVYPNPFNSSLMVRLADREAGQIQVVLTDMMGRQVYSKQYAVVAGASTLAVEMQQQLSEGVYLLQVRQGTASSTFRVVKQ